MNPFTLTFRKESYEKEFAQRDDSLVRMSIVQYDNQLTHVNEYILRTKKGAILLSHSACFFIHLLISLCFEDYKHITGWIIIASIIVFFLGFTGYFLNFFLPACCFILQLLISYCYTHHSVTSDFASDGKILVYGQVSNLLYTSSSLTMATEVNRHNLLDFKSLILNGLRRNYLVLNTGRYPSRYLTVDLLEFDVECSDQHHYEVHIFLILPESLPSTEVS